MSFISYAQNFEDVMLWRALKHVKSGFYIDVGANDPDFFSVTKAFYERGWRGINIEPVSEWFEKLEKRRPRDINLQVAAGDAKGEVTLYEIPGTGLSTLDEVSAKGHRSEKAVEIVERTVPMRTLTDICREYHEAPIHFLSVDVEGAERAVLQGLDLSRFRPWIILVEATLPTTQIESYKDWESILLAVDYGFVHFDGLNRFYVAREHWDMAESFHAPPNCFDDCFLSETHPFARHVASQASTALAECQRLQSELSKAQTCIQERQEASARERAELSAAQIQLKEKTDTLARQQVHIDNLGQELQARKAEIEELRISAQYWRTVAENVHREFQGVCNSRSWRMTEPLRKLMRLLRPVKSTVMQNRIVIFSKQAVRSVLLRLMAFVLRKPRLRQATASVVRKLPYIRTRLRRLAENNGLIAASQEVPSGSVIGRQGTDPDTSSLTPWARQIYDRLRAQ